jgi:uncharacterized protein YjbJ (UPF0337 family)
MEWDRIQANWKHYKAFAKTRWARLGGDQLDAIGGGREQLARQIETVYGITRGAAQMQLESWQGQQREPDPVETPVSRG